ncbi:MAG TPA: TIGR03668 family PPOX class F420-dependent oxidoreductase [Actinomycetota bacterium]|nr:TIGR03668 family PPOX class F420-dependent oxidoreductase [Actinomycetota bacterium]
MDREEALRRLAGARVGHLATADLGSLPHVVPVVFAVAGETIYWAVDQKPKGTRDLKRLRNIEANPNVQLVADHYEEDWSRLWWVRITGHSRTVEDEDEVDRALDALAQKFPQYRADPPEGPVVAIDIARVTAWESS